MTKSMRLAQDYGYENSIQCLEDTLNNSCIPGICTNSGCYYSTDVEADSSNGFCEECNTQTVASIQILMGVI